VFDYLAESEGLIRCFDPHASLASGAAEHIVISPRWGRLRRTHPLLATSPSAQGPGAAWQTARHNLLTCRDRSVQLAVSTYEHRIRVEARVAVVSLQDPAFDLHSHGHALLNRHGDAHNAVVVRREALFIRSLPPDPEGYLRFEFGNTFLLPISEEAMIAEAKHMW
jgi:hypothetical protein